jgi:diketogulonate reductase-like aldo/keto reductase
MSDITQKQLGSTGIDIPSLGFGTWRYRGGVRPLLSAIEQGARFIDTAETYGSEEVVGVAIRGCRPDVFVATKARPKNFRKLDLIRAAEGSLCRLGTDYIDLYQLHWPNYTIPIEETMAGMEELVESGKIRYIGVSNFSARELASAQRALRKHRIVSNQVRYSLIDRTIENGLLKFCENNQITIIAFSPLGADYSSFRAHDPGGILAQVAHKYGKTEAQVALNWVIKNSRIVAIPKASTVDHVIDDCGASGWELSDIDYAVLSNKVRCHRRGAIERLARRWVKRVVQYSGRAI